MKRLLALVASVAAATLAAACSPQPPAPAAPQPLTSESAKPAMKAPPTDLEKLAERLVTQSANVKEGEVVLISSGPENIELLEDIAVQVRKAGAFPLVTIGTDRMSKRLFDDVPAKYDSQTDAADLKLAESRGRVHLCRAAVGRRALRRRRPAAPRRAREGQRVDTRGLLQERRAHDRGR